MVRVLFVTSTLKRTGPTNVLYNLVSELDRTKFEPIVLTLSNEDYNFPSLWESFENLNIKVCSLALTRINGFLTGKQKIKKFIATNNIDVAHLYGFRPDLLVKPSKNLRVVSTINSNIYDDYTMLYGKRIGKIMAFLHVKSLKGKVGIACSNFVAEELNKRYGIDLKVIYNGIPNRDYTSTTTTEKVKIREDLKLPLDKKVFIFVGYLIYRKDPVTVIKAFLNSKAAKNSILLMIGDGPLMEECREICKSEIDSVKFFGNQPSTLNFLKASDYYISSAYSEGLPTSVMEAMGCGLPVILSNIKPHEELVEHIANWSYLFPTNNVENLSSKIDKITNDDYDLLSNNCRAVIADIINSSVMTRNYQFFYEKKI